MRWREDSLSMDLNEILIEKGVGYIQKMWKARWSYWFPGHTRDKRHTYEPCNTEEEVEKQEFNAVYRWRWIGKNPAEKDGNFIWTRTF